MDAQRPQVDWTRSKATWAWRIGRAIALTAACGLGGLSGVALVALHLIGWMSMGWTLLVASIVVALVVTAGWQLVEMSARRREAQQRAMIAAG